jgi:hypothetical protein
MTTDGVTGVDTRLSASKLDRQSWIGRGPAARVFLIFSDGVS